MLFAGVCQRSERSSGSHHRAGPNWEPAEVSQSKAGRGVDQESAGERPVPLGEGRAALSGAGPGSR